jgi:hypothetical protein
MKEILCKTFEKTELLLGSYPKELVKITEKTLDIKKILLPWKGEVSKLKEKKVMPVQNYLMANDRAYFSKKKGFFRSEDRWFFFWKSLNQ